MDVILQKCETHLVCKSKRPPFVILKLGTDYGLKRAVEHSLVGVSKLPGLLKQLEKEDIDIEVKNRILCLALLRYESRANQCPVHKSPLTLPSECCYLRRMALGSGVSIIVTDYDAESDYSSDDTDDVGYGCCSEVKYSVNSL